MYQMATSSSVFYARMLNNLIFIAVETSNIALKFILHHLHKGFWCKYSELLNLPPPQTNMLCELQQEIK